MSTIDLFVDLTIHAEDSDLDSGEVVNSEYRPMIHVHQVRQEIPDLLSTNEVAEVESRPPNPVADPIPLPLPHQEIQKAESEQPRQDMPPRSEGNRFVEAYISKRFRGVVSVGRVAGHNINTGLYKIDYGYGVEEITEAVLIRHRILFDDFRKIYHRSLCGRVNKYKKKKVVDLRVKKTTGVLRPKKLPSQKSKMNTYIPLAYRETKRDAYYWY